MSKPAMLASLIRLARAGRRVAWHRDDAGDGPWMVVRVGRAWEFGSDGLLYLDGVAEGLRPAGVAVAARFGMFGMRVVEGPGAPAAPIVHRGKRKG